MRKSSSAHDDSAEDGDQMMERHQFLSVVIQLNIFSFLTKSVELELQFSIICMWHVDKLHLWVLSKLTNQDVPKQEKNSLKVFYPVAMRKQIWQDKHFNKNLPVPVY